ncbi:MAG: IS110 family transposase [Bryobacteraceae bacterium]|nr:IS110 family transposase [Bryobacteraceae bacterium]
MEVLYRRCCGLDVHKDSITACVLILGDEGRREIRHKEFRTFTADLHKLRLWLHACKVEHVAMEATGVYWKPVWNILDGQFPLLLANARHMRNIPGRKTDSKDAEWIADLLAHGLLRPSFVPEREIRNLRDLTRYRVKLTQGRSRTQSRITKVLEDANLKLGSVASDIPGKSGRAMLDRIAFQLTDDIVGLADTRHNRLHASLTDVRNALKSNVTDHHRWMLARLLGQIDSLSRLIEDLEQEISRKMKPYEDHIDRLLSIPGVDLITAWTLIAELGTDMSKFPDAAHAASWAGLVPGNCESAGKRLSTRTRHGNAWIRRALCQSAWAVSRKKDCALTAFLHRVASRHGMKKAIVATAHRILVVVYHLLRDGSYYREEGGSVYDSRNPRRTVDRLTKRLQRLGAVVDVSFPDGLPQPKRRPGRPCKCVQRGIPCHHKPPLEQPNKHVTRSADL